MKTNAFWSQFNEEFMVHKEFGRNIDKEEELTKIMLRRIFLSLSLEHNTDTQDAYVTNWIFGNHGQWVSSTGD